MRKVTRTQRGDATLFCREQRSRQWISALAVVAALWASPAAQASSPYDVAMQNPAAGQDTANVARVVERLNASMSDELRQNFGLFIYIDKAESGPYAQRMYVFRRADSGDLDLLYNWPVSTGRENLELDPHGHMQTTLTPTGFFELDPSRLYADHDSSQWDEPMPYSMFFSWQPDGHKTGLAIHGTAESATADLGSRASAGCIRLATDNAHTLFDLVRNGYRAPTPELAYRESLSAVSSDGLLLHAKNGSLQMSDGYSVLVLVDDYSGDQRTSALD
jgi:hypothetical protein